MSFFTVRAGSSYHAVSEVHAEQPRQRISIQGWYHGAEPLPALHAPPSLSVIKQLNTVEWDTTTGGGGCGTDSESEPGAGAVLGYGAGAGGGGGGGGARARPQINPM